MNRFFDSLYLVFLKSNVFMAVCSIAFYLSGMMITSNGKLDNSPVMPSFLFFSTLLIYNVSQKRIGIKRNEISRSHRKQRLNYIVIILAGGVLTLHLFYLELDVMLFVMHLGIISVLYNIPYLNSYKLLPLRGIPLIKVFLIAYVWASIGAVLPALILGLSDYMTIFILYLCNFAFIVSITLPFDIRDFYKDQQQQLITIPGLIGLRSTKFLATFFLLISVVLQSQFVEHDGLLILNGVVLWLIFNASAGKRNFYYLLFVDGAIILFSFIIWVDKWIM